MGQKRLWALLTHFFTLSGKAVRVLPRPLRRSRASSPKGRADTPGNFTGQPGTVPPPLKPSPTGGRWRVAPDEGQHQLPRRGSQGLKPIAKVLGIMRRLSAVLLALPLRKDFHPLRGRCRGAHSKSSHIKRLLHKTLCSSLKYFTFTTDQMLNCTAQKAA